MAADAQSFLVIRRDNIGDVVCTTPLITALRCRFPDAWIGALVNDYAAPVLDHNPDVSAVLTYSKAKHRREGESVAALYWHRLQLIASLRRRRIDYVLLAAPVRQPSAERMARWVKPRHIVGFAGQSSIADVVTRAPEAAVHQVERCYSLLRAINVEGAPPPLKLHADPRLVHAMRARVPERRGPVVAVHLSAREEDRRWPIASFRDLIGRLLESGAAVVLTWAPGSEDNPRFPGDDGRARSLVAEIRHERLVPVPTADLGELIASLAVCDAVISSDGGPVHLGAALGKPVLCFFGTEDRRLWYPWGVPYELLQSESRNAADISVDEAWQAWLRLRERITR
jgi:ADP-heptose:LPS heptosyltransferase